MDRLQKIIARAGISSKKNLLLAMNDPKLVKAFGVPSVGAGGQQSGVPGGIEGYLYPDTYQFPPSTPAEKVLKRMRARLDEVMETARSLGYTTMRLDTAPELDVARAMYAAMGFREIEPYHDRYDDPICFEIDL